MCTLRMLNLNTMRNHSTDILCGTTIYGICLFFIATDGCEYTLFSHAYLRSLTPHGHDGVFYKISLLILDFCPG